MIKLKSICILMLFVFIYNNLQAQTSSNLILKKNISYFAFDNASKVLNKISNIASVRIVFDSNTMDDFIIDADWKEESLETIFNLIAKKTKSKYLVNQDGSIEFIAISLINQKTATTNKNPYIGNSSKTNITILGKVIDGETSETIPYALLKVKNVKLKTSSNVDGFFTLKNIPTDTNTIIISALGYADYALFLNPNLDLNNIVIELNPVSISTQEIIISAKRDDIVQIDNEQLSVIKMLPKNIEQLPNVGEKDMMRSFQLMPGVSAANESSSNLYVRGGTPDQNLVLYDGFTVYQVDHLYGFYSAFNTNALKNIQLYKGGFEAKYGGRLSSVTEITGKNGNQKKWNIGGDLSLLSANIFTEIPIKPNLTFIAAARRSYQGFLYDKIFKNFNKTDNSQNAAPKGPMGDQNTTPSSYFYDINAKLSYKPSEKDNISLSFFNGTDNLDNGFKIETPDFLKSQGVNINFSISDATKYGNSGSSLKWSRKWSPKFYSNTLVSFSHYFSNRDRTNSGTIKDKNGNETSIKTGTLEDNKLYDISYKSDFELDLNKNNNIGFGAFATNYKISYQYSQNDTSTILDKNDKGNIAGIYLQDKINLISNKLILTPGLRFTYFDLTSKTYSEPRFSLSYKLTNKLILKGAYGKYYQFANRVTREDILAGSRDFWTLSNNSNIPVSSSTHYISGISYEKNNYLFSVEAYLKNLENISEYSLRFNNGAPGQAITYEENFYKGTGISKGIEFLAQKKSGTVNGWVSYTLSKTDSKFDVYSSDYFAANQDVRNEFKIVGLYKWKRFELSATWIYASGKPYTAPSGAYSISLLDGTKQDFFTTTTKNSQRLPDYHRMDFSVNYRLLGGNGDDIGYIGFSLFNLYNRTNVWYKQYQIVNSSIVETNVNYLGITPNLTLSLKLR